MGAAAITAVVAIAALIIQYLTNDRALKQQTAIAREQRENERDQVLEARRQERIQEAYFGLVENFYRQATVHAWVKENGPPTPMNHAPLTLPSAEDLVLIITRAIFYGSPEVRAIIGRWRVAAAADDVDAMSDVLGDLMLQVNLELMGSSMPWGLEPPSDPAADRAFLGRAFQSG